ncbi:MAG TPA: glycosyltransferase family 39 protein [Pyrinomonadaceae bacterium]|nr:glycosyltransferase family 39 protein [Pyrinomonadaceae bacterium]
MFTRNQRFIILSLIVGAAAFRVAVVHWLPSDSAGDSIVYEQIARNVLEHHVYSHLDEAPFTPSFVRLPGYPLFLAGIYAVFGHTNNTAVRIIQALIDTGTCLLVAWLAWLWQPDERKKIITAITALALAAVNPFTTIYAATILTEVPATFLIVAACIATTIAFREEKFERELRWWALAGLLTGIDVLFRPEVGLITAAIGAVIILKIVRRPEQRLPKTMAAGAALSIAFILVLAPWTIRNWRTLHVFQPLAPPNGNMPGEFVPLGYELWMKTWMTDGEYLDDLLWNLDQSQIDVDELPDTAFDSQAEHDRVAALFDRYNEPGGESGQDSADPKPAAPNQPGNDQTKQPGESDDENDEDSDSGKDQSAKTPDLTPELDAAFGQIAAERIARHPFRYYVLLPLRRAHSLWFNTHSDFYPFVGNALPLNNPENNRMENFWLPIFAVLVGIYTVLGVGGLALLAMNGGFYERAWVLLVALIFGARLVLFSTAVSVEPRYVVEFFPILAVTGAIAIMNFREFFSRNKPADLPEPEAVATGPQ